MRSITSASRSGLVAAAATSVLAFAALSSGGGDGGGEDLLVFDGFDDTSLLQLNGGATTPVTGDGTVLRLTRNLGNQAGSCFSLETVDATSFSTFFAFRISDPGGAIFDCNVEDGADGIVFVVQSVSSGVGGGGGGIGFAGIPRSVGVEFDNWCNVVNNDPSPNHVGIDLNGSLVHDPDADFTEPLDVSLDDGRMLYAWVDYDGTVLRVYFNAESPIQPFQPIVKRELDLPAILEQDTGFVGFTSGTGAAWANHDIVYWEYTPFSPVCFGDFDGSGVIDGADLTALLGNWGGDLEDFDLNGDDVIDGVDVTVLLGRWGPCEK